MSTGPNPRAGQGALRSLRRELLAVPAERPWTCGVQTACKAARERLQRLRAMGDEYSSYRLRVLPNRLPGLESPEGLQGRLQAKEQTILRRQGEQRLSNWSAWLDEAWFMN